MEGISGIHHPVQLTFPECGAGVSRLRRLLVLAALLLVSSACMPKLDIAATQTAAVTDTPTPSATYTSTPTSTATHTPTLTPTETPTATITPTETLTPTAEIWLPIMPRATFTMWDISWGGPETWCPARGENVTCETEYRNYSGNCVVGMTCYDACGFYYAVNTLPPGGGAYIFSGPCY